jgi:hypothetical protein
MRAAYSRAWPAPRSVPRPFAAQPLLPPALLLPKFQQAVYAHNGQEYLIEQLHSRMEAGMVCDVLTGESRAVCTRLRSAHPSGLDSHLLGACMLAAATMEHCPACSKGCT